MQPILGAAVLGRKPVKRFGIAVDRSYRMPRREQSFGHRAANAARGSGEKNDAAAL